MLECPEKGFSSSNLGGAQHRELGKTSTPSREKSARRKGGGHRRILYRESQGKEKRMSYSAKKKGKNPLRNNEEEVSAL